jgi:hypothetical protein
VICRRASTAVAFAVAAGLAVPGVARATCPAWPGEFDPLPTVADSDPLRARWARLRADQLAARAAPLEQTDPIEANRLWERVLCLDPGSANARAGVDRSRATAVSRAADPLPAPAPRVAAAPARAAVPAKPKPRPRPSFDAPLGRAEELIRSARFDAALGEIDRLRPRIEAARDGVAARERVRLEVLAATAHIAFGDERAARESFARALAADPGFAPDARSTPPKLLRVYEEARSAEAPAVGSP